MIVLTMTKTKEKHEQEIKCAVGNIQVDVNIVKHEVYNICYMYVLISNVIHVLNQIFITFMPPP